MASLVTRVASKHRAVMIAVFALSARVWIEAVTESLNTTADLRRRVEQLEDGHAGDPAAHFGLADRIRADRPDLVPDEVDPPAPFDVVGEVRTSHQDVDVTPSS